MNSSSRSRSKRKIASSKKKQKTSTPSKSRIEHYMSPCNISKVIGSPIQHRRSVLDSISEVERSREGQRSSSDDGTNTRTRGGLFSSGKGDGSFNKSSRKSRSGVISTQEENVIPREVEVTGRQKKPNRPNNLTSGGRKKGNDSTLKNATIDKFLSPERSSLISTPTRFPKSGSDSASNIKSRIEKKKKGSTSLKRSKSQVRGSESLNDEYPRSSLSEEDTGGDKNTKNSSKNRSEISKDARKSPASLEDMPSTSTGIYHTKEDRRPSQGNAKGSKRKTSASSASSRKKQRAQDISEEGDISNEEDAVTRDDVTSIKKIKAKNANRYMASGDVETHMADKEFLANQVLTISKPFSLEAGPRHWIDNWKAQQSASDDEDEDIPDKVIHKALAKLNHAMNNNLSSCLSRYEQRKVLINVDEIRKEEHGAASLEGILPKKGRLTMGAALEEILAYYPSEWPGTDDIEDSESEQKDVLQRYTDIHARLTDLTSSLETKEEEKEQLQNLCSQLTEIDKNLKSCSDADFKKELDRTNSLDNKEIEAEKKSQKAEIIRSHGVRSRWCIT